MARTETQTEENVMDNVESGVDEIVDTGQGLIDKVMNMLTNPMTLGVVGVVVAAVVYFKLF